MKRHLTQESMVRLLSGAVSEIEVTKAVQHVRRCDRCWTVLAEVVAGRKGEGRQLPSRGPLAAAIRLVEEEERGVVAVLKARAWWAELRRLEPGEQLQRVRSVSAMQSLRVVEVVIEDAWNLGFTDPHLGEHTAYLAYSFLDLLADSRLSAGLRRDMQGEAMTVVANCRRLLADWNGALQAIGDARSLLGNGTGDPSLEATLLSIHSLLCSDTGNLDAALSYSGRALKIYRRLGDQAEMARTAIIEANALLSAGRPEDALESAGFALERISSGEGRLDLLARGIIIESLIVLGRFREAIHRYNRDRAVFEQAPDFGSRMRARYLEGRLLEAAGHSREAEKLYTDLVQTYTDKELYKEAFITLLTLFELHFRKGSYGKAVSLCREAIEACSVVEGTFSDQIRVVWEQLLVASQAGQLTEVELLRARQLIVRYRNVPPTEGIPQNLPHVAPLGVQETAAQEVLPEVRMPEPPAIPVGLNQQKYIMALEAFDRELVIAALRESGGSISEASRLLGMSRNGLKAKLRRYGL